MRKERHLKTIRERFGFNENLKDERDIRNLMSEVVEKIQTYKKYNYKKDNNFKFNLVKSMLDLDIQHKGVFYLRGLGEYGDQNFKDNAGIFKEDGSWKGYIDSCDAYFFLYDNTYSKRVNLKSDFKDGDKEYMEYVKYYVIDVTVNGWFLVLFETRSGDLDWQTAKNNIILQGNIGTLIYK
jgi:hypothetical protein